MLDDKLAAIITPRAGALACSLALALVCGARAAPGEGASPASARLTANALKLARWAAASGDTRGLPFVIIDKSAAQAYVLEPNGRVRGATPVLLGLAHGDQSVPGIGERPMAQIRPEERTTPAGRFIAEPGRNLQGEDILWVDYDAAVSMHRVRATHPTERRLERLASPTAGDNRISYGCINVPAAFYDHVLVPALKTFGKGRAVVYVLPETKSLGEVFGAYGLPEDDGQASTQGRPPQVSSGR